MEHLIQSPAPQLVFWLLIFLVVGMYEIFAANCEDPLTLDCTYRIDAGIQCNWECDEVSVDCAGTDNITGNITIHGQQTDNCTNLTARSTCFFTQTFSDTEEFTIEVEVTRSEGGTKLTWYCRHDHVTLLSIVQYSKVRDVKIHPSSPDAFDITWSLPLDFPAYETTPRTMSACLVRWSTNSRPWVKKKVSSNTPVIYYRVGNLEPNSRYDVQITCVGQDETKVNWSQNETFKTSALEVTTERIEENCTQALFDVTETTVQGLDFTKAEISSTRNINESITHKSEQNKIAIYTGISTGYILSMSILLVVVILYFRRRLHPTENDNSTGEQVTTLSIVDDDQQSVDSFNVLRTYSTDKLMDSTNGSKVCSSTTV